MKLYLSLFPVREKSIEKVEHTQKLCRVEFKIDDRSYLSMSNLSGKEIKLHLDEGVYFERTMGFIFGNTDIYLKPNETICLLKLQNKDFQVAGSDNIFPGNEVIDLNVEEDNIILKFHEHCMGVGHVYISIPETLKNFKVNGEVLKAEKINTVNFLKVAI
jgi:hypothetical protein